MRADQLLEGGDLGRVLPDSAVEDDVGAVGEGVGPEHVSGGVRAERSQRVLTEHLALLEPVDALGADRQRPVVL